MFFGRFKCLLVKNIWKIRFFFFYICMIYTTFKPELGTFNDT